MIQAANINTGNKQIDMNLNARSQAALGVMPVGNGMALEGPASQKALDHSGSGTGTHMLEMKHFTFINGTEAENIAKILEDEDVSIMAMVLSNLDAERSNAVFGMLPRDKQADVALIMAKTDFVDTVQIKTVEKKLKKKLESLIEGREQTVEILSHADNHTRELILTSIREKDPALAEKLQREIFKFEEIAGLTPAEIALTLEGITHEGIAVTLRGMSDDFTNTIVASLPKEAQKALRQWMAIGKPQPLSKVEKVRRLIVDNARRLEHEGRISRHIKPIEREAFGETV